MGARQRSVKARNETGHGVCTPNVTNASGETLPGTRDVAQRLVNAERDFIGTVQKITGCTPEEGRKAFNTLHKLKLLTLELGVGRYTVKHGSLLDAAVLRRAMADT